MQKENLFYSKFYISLLQIFLKLLHFLKFYVNFCSIKMLFTTNQRQKAIKSMWEHTLGHKIKNVAMFQ